MLMDEVIMKMVINRKVRPTEFM